ncbi:SurA N-terminal domain-containing protein [Desulforhopalus vacuolatus]|uniref:SurA N-terminal domain-containing protein n=1 Tax=Desulforhopalus vacuolatus TaxID=40414 RepID=UPI0019636EFF|nr:SurA N-terminal domain-containing protein [Desulforhopalus vacuolatus]MBM9518368.1 SurA N-terminal domain-containing protein [Desulforhopalus vacuolatus]
MLQAIRNKKNSTVIQIIVGIIVLVFVFWGFGADLLSGNRTPLTINGQGISIIEYNKAYNKAADLLSQKFSGNMPKNFAEQVNLKGQVANQLIRDTLLRQGAQQMGIVVSNEELRKAVESQPAFLVGGVFDMKRYKKVLAANRMTPTVFEKKMRVDHLSLLVVNAIQNFATINSQWELQNLYSQYNEKIAVQFVSFTPADFIDKVTVSEKQLAAWYKKNQDNYKSAPESRFRYATFLYSDVADQVNIDDGQAKKYYEDYTKEFTVPETRSIATIQFSFNGSESEAQLAEKLKKAEEVRSMAAEEGANFAALAKQYSDNPSAEQGGRLGSVSRGQIPFLDSTVFGLQQNEVSPVVKTPSSYNIFVVHDIKPGRVLPFADVKEQIISRLQQKEAQSLAFQLANETYEGILATGSLDRYADKNSSANFKKSEFITRDTAPADITEDPAFLQKSFDLGRGELSSLVKGDTGYAIFYVEDVKAPEIPALTTVRNLVEEDWRKEKAEELAKTAAEELLTAGRKEGLDKAAQAKGLKIEESGLMGRDPKHNDNIFPAALLSDCFTLSLSEPLPSAPVRDIATGKWYDFQLTRRDRPAMPEDAPEIELYKSSLLSVKQQRIFDAWLNNMWQTADIRQNSEL